MTSPAKQRRSASLGRTIGNMCLFSSVEPSLHEALLSGDASRVIKLSNELNVLARSAQARQSSMKSPEKAKQDSEKSLGVDLIKLFEHSLFNEFFVVKDGSRRSRAASQKMALLTLRPDLRPRGDPESIDSQRRERRLKTLLLRCKGRIERPSVAMKSIFREVEVDLRKAMASIILQIEMNLAENETATFH